MGSYLNLIELDTGRQLRLAQFGFQAERPSITEGGICFLAEGKWKLFSLETGGISDYHGEIPPPDRRARLEFTSPLIGGVGYCRLIVGDRVVNNFMGGRDSLGDAPISLDGRMVAYIGYPSKEGFGE